MKLEFTKQEKQDYLERLGYTIDTYITERNREFYSSDKEIIKIKIDIAYLEIKRDLDSMDLYHLRNEYGIHEVFQMEISKRIKEFIMTQLTK
jgi:hypothetical protein|tara:strand:+ start:5344 stop:5619 length:276 start_codon:yes stop_codon:yes gene_type:complete